jgi:hypothetical protein
VVLKQAVGVGLCGQQSHPKVRQASGHHGNRQPGAAHRLEGDADRRQRGGVEVMHLIDQEQRPRTGRLRHLADLAHEVGEVLLGIAGVGQPGGGLDIELERDDPAGPGDAERLYHPERPFDALLDAVAAAHLAQQARRHPSEGHPEVGLRSDLLHVGGRPAGLGGEHVELHQEHRLADATQARVDHAALVAARGEALDQRLEVLELIVAASQRGWLSPGARGVGIVSLVHVSKGF